MQDWFRHVENTKVRYDIQDEGFYNFDGTGFMMGHTSTRSVITSTACRGRKKKHYSRVIESGLLRSVALGKFCYHT